jgi:hypothetical protein
MYTKYKVVKGVKPAELQDEELLAQQSYATWWCIKDMETHDRLPDGFDSLTAAQACCQDLNGRSQKNQRS